MTDKFVLDDKPIKLIGWWTDGYFETIEVGRDRCTHIDCIESFLGEYSILWLQVWHGEKLYGRYNARNIDSIEYDVSDPDLPSEDEFE